MSYNKILVLMLILAASQPSRANIVGDMENYALGPQAAPSGPNPDATGKYHLGNGVSPPKLLSAPDPAYTNEARRKKVEGVTVVSVTVDTSGNPQDVGVARSMSEDVSKKYKQVAVGLDKNAMEAVKQYRFQPGQFQGKPVPVEIQISVNFRIY